MSEYQYYEFQAIDKPLSATELEYIRSLSRRVHPTPTHAVFTYSFGDFPARALDVLAKYYDAMLYLANWGTKQLVFRFPRAALDLQALKPYSFGVEMVELTTTKQRLILDIGVHPEGGGGEWIEGEGTLTALLPLRDDLLRGDYRVLYLAWLQSVQDEEGADDDDAEQIKRQRAKQQRREAAQVRQHKLDALARCEDTVWKQVTTLIEQKYAAAYDQAVALLADLRDLVARQGQSDQFKQRVNALTAEYARRPALLERLRKLR